MATRHEKVMQSRRKDARRRTITRLGVTAASLGIIAAIVSGLVSVSAPTTAAAPIGSGSTTLPDGSQAPISLTETSVLIGGADAPVAISLYEDFSCSHCQAYEEEVGVAIGNLVADGTVSIEYHPIQIVTQYGVRAAGASTCVAENDPKSWWSVHSALFAAHNPMTDGWSRADFAANVKDLGVTDDNTLSCIEDGRWEDWIGQNTDTAAGEGITSTPTLLIDGEKTNLLAADDLLALVEKTAAERQ